MSVQELDSLPPLQDLRPRNVTEQIFDLLYARVVGLDLPPGAKLSEAEVAAQMGDRYLAMLTACEPTIAKNVTTNLYDRHLKPLFVGTT